MTIQVAPVAVVIVVIAIIFLAVFSDPYNRYKAQYNMRRDSRITPLIVVIMGLLIILAII